MPGPYESSTYAEYHDAEESLIPKNGVHITEAYSPKGFFVAKYDAEGFTSHNRWFETYRAAAAYAHALKHLKRG